MHAHSFLWLSLAAAFLFAALPGAAHAQLEVSRLFADHMVIQRDVAVPVWGTAPPGTRITVTFDDERYEATADGEGRWRVELAPHAAGGPHTMTIEGAGERREVRDVLVGDVWVASGQSNMEWTVADAMNAEAEIAAADDAAIRHFKVPQSWALEPEETLAGGTWSAASPATVGEFSAVGYFFARALREHVDVPIGLLNTSWGGSRIEPWMSAEALGMSDGEIAALATREADERRRILDQLRSRLSELPETDAGLVDGEARWADPALDVSAWEEIAVPGLWEGAGYEGMDGIAWYRTTFELSEAEAASGVRLGLAMIDDRDQTWVNGELVGETNGYNIARVYEVAPGQLRAGTNVVAIRVDDTGGGGGIHGDPSGLYVETGTTRRPLAGPWRFKVGAVRVDGGSQKNQIPTLLYNKMVHPIIDYPVAGFLWYQGESNAGSVENARAYRELFPTMIQSWRELWGQGDLPFLWVQLANFMAPDDEPPAESGWAVLRESQTATLALPNTGQAVIIDLGEADDIHPRNKQDVGKRLALLARKVAYGEELVHSGPVYRSHEIRDGRVEITFDHVGGGLVTRGADGVVGGFAVAGEDGRYVWADAVIEGDRVVVSSPQVPRPVSVRYAWGNNPVRANLYNQEGLPAAPFRAGER